MNKLTDEQVYKIRELYDAMKDHRHIASRFGVARSTVTMIGRRKTWKHLPEKAK